MDPIVLESPAAAESSFVFCPLAGCCFHSMLKESVDRFLVEVRRESCDLSAFRPTFFLLLQSSVDPPLEVIWFYAALGYHEAIRFKKDALDRVSAVRDLLQLLSTCSASCNGPKSAALLAPVVSELYHCIEEEKKLSGKAAKKLRKEIVSLAEGLIGYISICVGKSSDEQELSNGHLLSCFIHIVQLWTAQHSGGGDGLGVLFPLLSDEIRVCFKHERCGIGYLAGIVIAEAFLLSLSLKARVDGSPRPDLQKDIRIWAVSSMSVLQNCVSLSSTDECLLRNTLYDAVILVDYSFLNPGVEVEHFNVSMMNLVLRRLVVTHEAVRIARDKGDHRKAISYTNAFSTSSVPDALIKWTTYQAGLENLSRPNSTTPQALLKWLMEEQGLKLFDNNISELCSKLIFEESNLVSESTKFDSRSKQADDDLFFFDNKGKAEKEAAEDEHMGIMDAAFLSAAHSMKSEASKGRRKRKEWAYEEAMSQLKFVKYKIHDDSVKDYFNTHDADCISGSEMENPPSAEEMEE